MNTTLKNNEHMMLRSVLKISAAMGIFGLVHSALASRAAKQVTADALGERNRNGLYRVLFIGQSLATFALLADYIRRQPNRELYHIRGPLALVMHAGQIVSIGYATSAAHQVGISRILGLESFLAWLGDGPVPAEPPAQGPALDSVGETHAAGPFAWSRHPLNFAPVPIFWLWPRMTTNLLAFNLASTVYLIIGSKHEEFRLLEAYGEAYKAYQQSDVPYYLPWPVRHAAQPLQEAKRLDELRKPVHQPASFAP